MPASYWDTVIGVDFRAGEHRFHKMSGWSDPDWTSGRRFTIDLGRLPKRHRSMLRLTASPFLHQRFEVFADGTSIGKHAAEAAFVASFPLPPSTAMSNQPVVIAIQMAEPKRPCDHLDSRDDRELGLMINRIEILGNDTDGQADWAKVRPISSNAKSTDKQIFSMFESLGDNCELGFVQKRSSITGSSLLRFCATPVDRLLDGLNQGFSGIAEPEGVSIIENGPDHAREYQVILDRYGLHYHTLTFTHEASRTDVHDRELDKLHHKHTKFLDGLTQRDRIYVLKQNDGLQIGTVWTIWLALQRYGANTLMWVRKAAKGEQPGDVRVVSAGLLEATVASFARYDDATGGDDRAWTRICRQGIELVTRQSSTRA